MAKHHDVDITFRAPSLLRERLRDLSRESGWGQADLWRAAADLLLSERHRLVPKQPVSGLPRQGAV
jgi:hypothetical protein